MNTFLTVIPDMVMKFHKFDIFDKQNSIFDLSSALACRVESIKAHCQKYLSLNAFSLYLNT